MLWFPPWSDIPSKHSRFDGSWINHDPIFIFIPVGIWLAAVPGNRRWFQRWYYECCLHLDPKWDVVVWIDFIANISSDFTHICSTETSNGRNNLIFSAASCRTFNIKWPNLHNAWEVLLFYGISTRKWPSQFFLCCLRNLCVTSQFKYIPNMECIVQMLKRQTNIYTFYENFHSFNVQMKPHRKVR